MRRWWVLAAVPFWMWNDFSVWLGLTDLGQVHFVAALVVLSAVWHTGKAPRSSEENRGATSRPVSSGETTERI
jgi:hypothetical protein